MSRGELRHHIDEGHIKKDAGGGGKHPGGEVVQVAQGQSGQHAHEGKDRGEDIVEDRLLDCHARLEKHCKVTWIGETGQMVARVIAIAVGSQRHWHRAR